MPSRRHRFPRPRTALVTGGGTGIGRGIALALARRRVNVALVGRRREPLESVGREIMSLGASSLVITADLADANRRQGIIEQVHAGLGPLDLLVNNAGAMLGGDLSTLDPLQIERAVALNLAAPIELTRQALPGLSARLGIVVLVASGSSLVPMPSMSVYTATKSGLRAFGESVRYELEPLGVRLLTVYPSGTDTAMVRGMAQAAGLPGWALADPVKVGERIVRAALAGKRELTMGSDQALAAIYRLAPWLVRALFRSQQARFSRMMRGR